MRLNSMPWRLPVLALAVVLFGLPSNGRASAKTDAKRHFDNGLAMMQVEDFTGAAVEFEASVAIFPTKSALFNLAMCHKAAHRYPEALAGFRRLIGEFGKELDEEMQNEVKTNLAAINQIIGDIEIQTNLPGATVLLDGRAVGQTPLKAPLSVGAGEHRVRVSLPGYTDVEHKVTVIAGAKEVVQLTLIPVPASTALPVGATPPAAAPADGAASPEVPAQTPAKDTAKASKPKPGEDDPNLALMEKALERNLARDYARYQKSHLRHTTSFVDYQFSQAKSRRNKGIVATCVIAPVLAGAGLGLYFYLWNEPVGSETADGEVDTFANDLAAVTILGLGSVGATVALIVGAVKWGKGQSTMNKIKPHLKPMLKSSRTLQFAGFKPLLTPRGAPLGAALNFTF